MAAPTRCLTFFQKYVFILRTKHLLNSGYTNLCTSRLLTITSVNKIHCHCVYRQKEPLDQSRLKKMMDSLTDKFSEARELLADARESQGTVYFSEDMEEAETAVKETLNEYKNLLESLSDTQRQDVIATLGLRMEELKAQQAAMEESLKD